METIPISCLLSQTREVLHTNSTMLAVHMIVHRTSLRESLHAHPADMGSTSRTGHMIAAERLLDHDATLGTVLDAEFLLGRPQCLVAAGCAVTVLVTGQTVVRDIAGCAYSYKACRTYEQGAFTGTSYAVVVPRWVRRAVHLPAVWGGTVLQIVEMAGYVGCESGLKNIFQGC